MNQLFQLVLIRLNVSISLHTTAAHEKKTEEPHLGANRSRPQASGVPRPAGTAGSAIAGARCNAERKRIAQEAQPSIGDRERRAAKPSERIIGRDEQRANGEYRRIRVGRRGQGSY